MERSERGKMMLELIRDAIETLQLDEIQDLVTRCLEQGGEPVAIIEKAISPGMIAVGEKFESSEYFLGELILAGHTASRAMEILEQRMEGTFDGHRESIILATVKGDMHEIGKNIVAMLLKANGFRVLDLGVDVDGDTILEAVREHDVRLIGLSLLLSSVVDHLKEIIDTLSQAGLRQQVKIVIGGPCTSERLRMELGADAYADDAIHGVDIFKQLSA